jgi:hypothetical protein
LYLYRVLISSGSVFDCTLLDQRKPLSTLNGFGVQLAETISTAKWFWHSGTVMMTVMMMNDDVDNEIEDSGNHFHSKMVLEYNSQKPYP